MENTKRFCSLFAAVMMVGAISSMARANDSTVVMNYTLVGTPACADAVATATLTKTPLYTQFRVDVYNIFCAEYIDYYVNGKFAATRQTHEGHADLGMDTRYNNTVVPPMGPDALLEVRLHESDLVLLTSRPAPAEGEGEGEVTNEGESEGEVSGEGEGEVTNEGEGEGEVSSEGEGEGEGEVTNEGEGEVSSEGEGEGEGSNDLFGVEMRQAAGKNGYYYAGTDLVIRIRVRAEHSEGITALGVTETLPEGWLVTGILNDAGAAVEPQVGTGGTVNFAWINVPMFPVELQYTVSIPADAAGPYAITGETLYRGVDTAQLSSGVVTTPVVPGLGPEHCTSADSNHDWNISLSEVLRIVQMYNSGQIHCDATSEDGYAPGSGDQTCTLHNSDHLTPDWKIELSELLRLIQFYNANEQAYHAQDGTEDGFSPGTATN